MDMPEYTAVEYSNLETLAKMFTIPAIEKQFIEENNFNNAPVRGNANPMNRNCAFTGSYSEKPLWYRYFDLRRTNRLR